MVINKKTKYGNKKVVVNGIKFDSKKEANRYAQLKLLERANKITDLKLQPKFLLQESFKKNGKTYREITYIADFSYYDKELGKTIIEDTKGFKIDVYRLKKKLFEYKYKDYEIKEL